LLGLAAVEFILRLLEAGEDKELKLFNRHLN
jgi:hypothetical protein